ncbi:hypothetical protein [Streptomyces sp. NPDC007991]|uniref:hypothetical protein n=1 Tax=Streptomyces sp. NPDC007991 TaxID=3364803 RepID=UPI0036E8A62B
MRFADDHLIPLVDEGLGNSAYLVDLGDGRALAVDASRDLRALRTASERRGLSVAGALVAGVLADAYDLTTAIWTVAVLTAVSGLVVAVRMDETHPRPAPTNN